MDKQEILNTIFNKLVDEKHWNKHLLDLELMNQVAEIVKEMQVKKLNIDDVSKRFCQHNWVGTKGNMFCNLCNQRY